MNTYQTTIYNDLMNLVRTNEAFYFKDFDLGHQTYRIFNYRFASYTDFMLPSAMECRGIMFQVEHTLLAQHVTGDVKPVRLAAMPMAKFFNLNENPLTMGLDLEDTVAIYEKADGSLISTYTDNSTLRLKSKGSLYSDVAIAAAGWLDKHPSFKEVLFSLTLGGFTVNLEWCAPDNRIVLAYMEPALKILNIRNLWDGGYVRKNEQSIPEEHWVKKLTGKDLNVDPDAPYDTHPMTTFVDTIPEMTGIEGYVLELYNGQRVKVKCDWYLGLHRNKESVQNPRRLFECILDGAIDDVRTMFHDDPLSCMVIDEMQAKVNHLYNEMVFTVERFYNTYQGLDRKTIAAKGKERLSPMHFQLAMKLFDWADLLEWYEPNQGLDREAFEAKALAEIKRKHILLMKLYDYAAWTRNGANHFEVDFDAARDHVLDLTYKSFLKSKWKELGLRDATEGTDDES